MTQENKELLLRDLSARLTYGVIVDYKEHEYDTRHWIIDSLHIPTYSESGILIDTDYEGWINFTEYKGCGMSTGSRPLRLGKMLPYLCPMSSMTKDEKKAYHSYCDYYYGTYFDTVGSIDWLNAHHFDYRGLIEKGLALEAPEGMYNINK
jgi:hypothetical protein